GQAIKAPRLVCARARPCPTLNRRGCNRTGAEGCSALRLPVRAQCESFEFSSNRDAIETRRALRRRRRTSFQQSQPLLLSSRRLGARASRDFTGSVPLLMNFNNPLSVVSSRVVFLSKATSGATRARAGRGSSLNPHLRQTSVPYFR